MDYNENHRCNARESTVRKSRERAKKKQENRETQQGRSLLRAVFAQQTHVLRDWNEGLA